MMSGLPALPIAVMRPSRTPTSALTMPQWSRMTAPVMTRSGVPFEARVASGLAHRLADHLPAAEDGLVAPAAQVPLDLDEQRRVGQPDPVARGRPVEQRVAFPAQLTHAPSSPALVGRIRGHTVLAGSLASSLTDLPYLR